ncbi:MAG: chorismate mutase [Halobacteriota archaeon]
MTDESAATTGEPAEEDDAADRLAELRAEIRDIDRQLVSLIAERTDFAADIAEVKAERGLPTTDESQEERVLERVRNHAEDAGIDPEYIEVVFETLIELNKVEQRESR